MSDITNGKGGIVSVTATPQLIALATTATNGVNQKTGMTCKVWNVGANTVYAVVNVNATGEYTESAAVPIPAGESFPFVGQPMRSLCVACKTGITSTIHYGAY